LDELNPLFVSSASAVEARKDEDPARRGEGERSHKKKGGLQVFAPRSNDICGHGKESSDKPEK